MDMISMKLDLIELKIKSLTLICEKEDILSILLDDIDLDLDLLINKIELYKEKSRG
jgi:hypothetical protein